MSAKLERLAARLEQFVSKGCELIVRHGEVTLVVPSAQLVETALTLRDDAELKFAELIDVCGVDYLAFGRDEWFTDEASGRGFSRGRLETNASHDPSTDAAMSAQLRDGGEKRFASVYHLLSIEHNVRLRLRVYAPDNGFPVIPSVVDVWSVANWFEREAFDLYGIVYDGHPDLRRLLTDYGFIGHPFRKDFPLSGNVEVIYDAEKKRVVYQPVSIEPRINVPRVIRNDSRYLGGQAKEGVTNA